MKAARAASVVDKRSALTANQRSAETDATGWENDANATIASAIGWAADGAKSVQLSATASGDMIARTTPRPGRGGLVIIRGKAAGQVPRSVQLGARFLDAGGNEIGRAFLPAVTEQRAVNPLPVAPPGWPNYTGYTPLVLTNSNYNLSLDPNTDYLITCGEKITRPVQLYRGRNLVAPFGLDIEIPTIYRAAGQTINTIDTARRALYFNQPRGHVWVEGGHVSSPTGYLGDAVQMNGASALSFTFANCRFVGMRNPDGETFSGTSTAQTSLSTNTPKRIYAGSAWAQNASASTGWHDVTNFSATDPIQVGTDTAASSVLGGAPLTINPGATERVDLPVNTELWAVSPSPCNVLVNSGGNHPDGIQCYGSRTDPTLNIPFRIFNTYMETNYQGLFFQSTPVTLTMDRVVISGIGQTKDGVPAHGVLFWHDNGPDSLRTITNSFVVVAPGLENLATRSGSLPRPPGSVDPFTQLPDAYAGLQMVSAVPFDPAPAAGLGLSYVSPGYAGAAIA